MNFPFERFQIAFRMGLPDILIELSITARCLAIERQRPGTIGPREAAQHVAAALLLQRLGWRGRGQSELCTYQGIVGDKTVEVCMQVGQVRNCALTGFHPFLTPGRHPPGISLAKMCCGSAIPRSGCAI